jgi:predicted PurR-regulated permease PerM
MSWARFIFLLLLPSFIFAGSTTNILNNQNYSYAQSNQIITNATKYISSINQSGYLIFYPNLTQAYKDLTLANQFHNSSPDTSITYALMAKNEASIAYTKIISYKIESLTIMIIAALISLVVLYLFMKPVNINENSKKKNIHKLKK